MAKFALNLNKFKASGVYTFEYDNTETITLTNQTLRLIVGFSRKGIYNSPVFLRDKKESRAIFGGPDNFLEKRGSYFQRTIEAALDTAPVFALNIIPFNNKPINQGGDATDYVTFSLDSSVSNGNVKKALVSSFFNKERFWVPSPEYLQATVDSKPVDKDRLFSFVNLGQEQISILIKKSKNTQKYNLPAFEYFANREKPAFIGDYDLVSEYFIDVYFIKGNWTNYNILSQNLLWSKYFTPFGLKADKFDEFLSLDDITLVASFTGAIIPDFIDNLGNNQSIDKIINNAFVNTGILCTLNKKWFDNEEYVNSPYKIDTIGNNLLNSDKDSIEFLSYYSPSKSVLKYKTNSSLAQLEKIYNVSASDFIVSSFVSDNPKVGKFFNLLTIKKPSPLATGFTIYDYEEIRDKIKVGSLIKNEHTSPVELYDRYSVVYDIIDNGDSLTLVLGSPMKEEKAFECLIDTINNYIGGPMSAFLKEADMVNTIPGTVPNQINIDIVPGAITPVAGDLVLVEYPGAEPKYFRIDSVGGVAPNYILTIDTTPNTLTGPYYLDNFISYSLNASEYGISPNINNFKVTIFKTSTSPNRKLIPEVQTPGISIVFEKNVSYEGIPYLVTNLRNSNSSIISNKYLPYSKVRIFDVATNTEILPTNDIFIITNFNLSAGTFEINDVTNNTLTGVSFTGFSLGNDYRFEFETGEVIYAEAQSPSVLQISTNLINSPSIMSLYKQWFFEDTLVYKNYVNNILVNGDRIKWGALNANFNYLKYKQISIDTGTSLVPYDNILEIEQYSNINLTNLVNNTNIAFLDGSYIGATLYQNLPTTTFNSLAIYSQFGKDIIENLQAISVNGKKFVLNQANAQKLNIGDYVLTKNSNGEQRFIKIISKVMKYNPVTNSYIYEYETYEEIDYTIQSGNKFITKLIPIENFVDTYKFILLNGFQITNYHLPTSEEQLEKILGYLFETNIAKTLADKNTINFRYIVDTFDYGLRPMMGAKRHLSRLAKMRQKCMAILNMPFIQRFMDSTDPRFTDLPSPQTGNPKPLLQTKYIVEGGNLSLGPSWKWSLPDEEHGAKFLGVFGPHPVVLENNKEIIVPVAGYVSNNFVSKFISGNPYSITAGQRRGILSIPNFRKLEYDFFLEDREYLEPFGINTIVNVRNIGPMIYGNQSGFQRKLSALNNLHIRDLLITIENDVETILENYVFELNNVQTRQEIVSILSNYLDGVRVAGGIDTYSVVMNDKNNRKEIIRENFGVVDIEIEPVYGLQKIINRITLKRSGGAVSGGFVFV